MVEKIVDVLLNAAQQENITPYVGAKERINSVVEIMPALWIEPPLLAATKGREERRDSYKVELKLMAIPQQDMAKEWSGLSVVMERICRQVEKCEFVSAVSQRKSSCVLEKLTSRGEIALEAQLEIEVVYKRR